MITHHLTIALRNLRKYKAQTVISVCAMAVSITLMSTLTSFLLQFDDPNKFDVPYAHRVERLMIDGHGSHIPAKELDLLLNHQSRIIEEKHYRSRNRYNALIVAKAGERDERSKIEKIGMCDPAFFTFTGTKSALSGQTVDSLSNDEIFITERLAYQLYGGDNPIGASISVHLYNYDGETLDKSYVIKDVIKDSESVIDSFNNDYQAFVTDARLPEGSRYSVYMLLREGADADDLGRELSSLSSAQVSTVNVGAHDKAQTRENTLIRDCTILFLFLFVCVSFSSYLRQECQLFRLREREIAIRTCCGSKPGNLFALLLSEILIVLILTFGFSIILDCITQDIVLRYFPIYIDQMHWSMSGTVYTSLITIAILAAISCVAVELTVRRIRRDQTGLAMRMKPAPKHRLRNAGITLQMIISLVFAWLSVFLLTSSDTIKYANHMPRDIKAYTRPLNLCIAGTTEAEKDEIYNLIERIGSIERIYRFNFSNTVMDIGNDRSEKVNYMVYRQIGNDLVDFHQLQIDEAESYNPDRNVLVSRHLKQYLMDHGLWNGRTVTIDGEDYDVRGTYDEVPFDIVRTSVSAIITDKDLIPDSSYFYVILPKTGRDKEVRADIDAVLRQVLPSRIDVGTEVYFIGVYEKLQLMASMLTIINILVVVSIVTTVATIYASVSLDTRRRRKEMALRKLNGAKAKVIRGIFLRSYIVILVAAVLITLPVCIIMGMSTAFSVNGVPTDLSHILTAYLMALAIITAITALTIYWKIRQVMRVDPVQYLKE